MLSAIILAAGKGKRLNNAVPKPLVKIGRNPAIIHSLSSLDKHPDIDEIIIVLSPANQREIFKVIKSRPFKKIKSFVSPGLISIVLDNSVVENLFMNSGWTLQFKVTFIINKLNLKS